MTEPALRNSPGRRVRHCASVAACLALLGTSATDAQTRLDARLLPQTQAIAGVAPGAAMLASAILPGAGQYLLGHDRWVPFTAVEVWAWITFIDRRTGARSLATEYRDLAWTAARRVSVGGRIDPTFEYYESMSHFEASGLLDADPRQAGVQPETDLRTFNGEQWALARSLFFPGGFDFPPGSPQHAQALKYYMDHAIGPALTWAWGDRVLEQQAFRELIRRSDESYRTATQVLGMILVNHIVSAVDALVLGRTARAGASRLRLDSRMERGVSGPRITLEARFPW